MKKPRYTHWCGHCGQTVELKRNGKMVEHICVGAWFANDAQYVKALIARSRNAS